MTSRSSRIWHFTFTYVLSLFCLSLTSNGQAHESTWDLDPVDNQWQNPANWTPEIVPHGSSNIAIFGQSHVTDIMLGTHGAGPNSTETHLDRLQFNAGPHSYRITIAAPDIRYTDFLSLEGDGIVSYRTTTQNFIIGSPAARAGAEVIFRNSATVTGNIVFTTLGEHKGSFLYAAGAIVFYDSASAGNAQIINEGATVTGGGGGATLFDGGGAQNAVIINNPGTVRGAKGGSTLLNQDSGNVNQSTFINNGATVAGAEGGTTTIERYGVSAGATYLAGGAGVAGGGAGYVFVDGGSGSAYFTAGGGSAPGAAGGLVELRNYLSIYTEATVVTAEGGTNGGLGGTLLLDDTITQRLSQLQILGNGLLDLSGINNPHAIIGSLAGDGMVNLAGHQLTVGNNNMTATFSGVIEDEGSLLKSGAGTLTLRGASTYQGSTSMLAGTLVVANVTGSATGEGGVRVSGGTLGGSGIIAGAVTIGTGAGAGAILSPGSPNEVNPGTLTLLDALTFNADATYYCEVDPISATADRVVANGITINAGTQVSFSSVTNGTLTSGTILVLIDNTSAVPVAGTFANLADGSSVVIGNNTFQADYSGGDGNDLTLTVVP